MARILFDGLNAHLRQGTGIATYTRTLVATAAALGHDTMALYALSGRVPTDPLVREMALFAGEMPNTGLMTELMHLLDWRAGQVSPVPVPLSGMVLLDPIRDRVPPVNHFLAAWDVFRRARRYFARTGRFLTVASPLPVDIAHFTAPMPLRVAGAANVYTIHDLVPLRLPYAGSWQGDYVLSLHRALAKSADRIVTISESARNDLIETLDVDPGRIVTTWQTSDLVGGKALCVTAPPFGLGAGEYLLFTGAIEPKKNVARLLEAHLAADLPIPLVLTGGAGWHNDQERALLDDPSLLIQHGPHAGRRRFIHVGFVSRDNVLGLLKGARALAFPSLYEGFGLPVLEAMAVGTPVLTSTTSSLPEVAGDAAILVDPLDVQAIAAWLRRLVQDDALCQDLRRRGLLQADRFRPALYRERVAKLYDELAPGVSGPARE